jgi:microcystin-dependent protein
MVAINFPNSPEIDELFSVGNRTWKWNGTVWQTVTTPTGSQGDKAGHRYEFSDNTTVSQPADGAIKFNNSSATAVTTISVSNETKTGIDITNFLNDLDNVDSVTKFYLTISSNDNYDPTFTVFRVGDVTVNSEWTELSVLHISGTTPSNGEQIVLNYDRTGDRGPTGPTGAIGPTGPNSLPSYTGNDGKFLTTDGLDAFWENVDALPLQTGNSGKYLTTDGTDPSWEFLAGAVYQDLEPTGPLVGQIWVDSDASASVLNQNDYLLKTDAAVTYLTPTGAANTYLTPSAADAEYLAKDDFELVSIPIGGITQYAGATSPSVKYAICDGAAVSRTTYATLFDRIGTTYGVGNNSTTFNLPNLKGNVPVGRDSSQSEFDTLGETGGFKTHTLTEAQMPSHTHIQNPHGHNFLYGGTEYPGWNFATAFGGSLNFVAGNGAGGVTSIASNTATNQLTGGGLPHNNLQPYIVMNYLIRII